MGGRHMVLHQRWQRHLKSFKPTNERTAYVDLEESRLHIRLITAYFTHSGYRDQQVQQVYDTLGRLIESESARGFLLLALPFLIQ